MIAHGTRSPFGNTVGNLPEGWHATHFAFKETGTDGKNPDLHVMRRDLVTAFFLCPRSSIFCFFLLHFLPEDTEKPVEAMRQLARTFQDHSEDAFTPWQLFDIAFKVPREFALEKTQFDIGAKLMVFGWRRRRFHLWHFSCADMFLKDGVTPEAWACGYLNGLSAINGPVFRPDGNGGITWRRHRIYLFGHREEIARWCHRYRIGFRRFDSENQLAIWVFNYRREEDLRMLPPG